MLGAEQLVDQLLTIMHGNLVGPERDQPDPKKWTEQRFQRVVGSMRDEFVAMWRGPLAALPWRGFLTPEERRTWIGHPARVGRRSGRIADVTKGGFKVLLEADDGEKLLVRGSEVVLEGPPPELLERVRRLPGVRVDVLPNADPGLRARLTRDNFAARVWLVGDELRQLDWEGPRAPWAAEWEGALAKRTWRPRRQVVPPESFKERMRANLAALRLVQKGPPYSEDEVEALRRYTGFGGLSLKAIKEEIPEGLGPASRRSLIDEYYTPVVVADALADLVRPHLAELAGITGRVLALEPSAGIGRLIMPLELPTVDWIAVELSEWSAKILRGVAPDVQVYNSSFEAFFRDYGPEYYGRVGLVVSNPPYSAVRGASEYDDPDRETRDLNAAEYFIWRACTMLKPGGLGVFLVQHTIMDGTDPRFRERLLKIAHLDVAFRLPSDLFPGAKLVVDIIVLRARGGALPEVDDNDKYIVDGEYFKNTPQHVLGTEVREGARRGYQVEGTFRGLPTYEPRPRCETCAVSPLRKPWIRSALSRRVDDEETPPEILKAVSLGSRVDAYGQRQARGEYLDPGAWEVLSRELQEWAANFGNPWENNDLAARAERNKDLQRFRALFTRGGVLSTDWLTPPRETVQEGLRDFLEICQHLWRNSRAVSIPRALKMHAELGLGTIEREQVEQLLENAGWAIDGAAWDRAMPMEHYLTGDLWERVDHARAKNSPLAQRQIAKLIRAIAPYPFEEINELTPKFEWVSEELRSEWASRILDQKVRLVNTDNGFVYADEPKPAKVNRGDTKQLFLGWFNEDMEAFQPAKKLAEEYGVDVSQYEKDDDDDDDVTSKSEKEARPSLTQAIREAMQRYWLTDFRTWVAEDPERKARVTEQYNRAFRGFAVPSYPREFPLPVAWNPERMPHWWQFEGAARLLDQRGGLCAYDVGLGKTITAILTIAKGKEMGAMKRVVVVVPNTVTWQWVAEFARSLPSFRVGVVGSKLRRRIRDGRETLVDELDTPEERARKWIAFQRGVYDVMICTATAFPRVQVDLDALTPYYEELRDFRRLLRDEQKSLERLKKKLEKEKTLQKGPEPSEADVGELEEEEEEVEGAEDEDEGTKKPRKWTERDEAILAEGVAGFLRSLNDLPPGQREDPGVIWNRLGVDALFVDEAQRYKELFTPPTIDGRIPKFMGSGSKSSKRAWQLDARAAVVRMNQGGTGVYLLSATPAKNSPLELYNLIRYVDADAFKARGIMTHLGFVERFCDFSYVWTVSVKLEEQALLALTGFKNLDELRAVLFRYSAFYTAEQVGLKLPKPAVRTITVEMDEEQKELYSLMRTVLREAIRRRKRNKILSAMANMDLIALHPELYKKVGEGKVRKPFWNWSNAGTQEYPESPKLARVAQQILANNTCQHLVFLENLAAQRWLVETLVRRGMPRDQIGVMNAKTAPRPAQRQRMAIAFTGVEAIGEGEPEVLPTLRVLIVNSVAYEGIDLQRRTCALHHVDLPWTPATIQQRNGRGVRQGNKEDVVEIIYYLAERSMDALHFAAITGKIGWMEVLIAGSDRATNNPAAQQGDSISALSLIMDEDKADFEELRRRMRAEEEEKRVEAFLKNLDRRIGGIRGRIEEAQETTDPVDAARLRDEARKHFDELRAEAMVRAPRVAAELVKAERILWTRPVYVAGGLLVWPGRWFRHSSGTAFETGYMTEDEIAYRQADRAEWKTAGIAQAFGEAKVQLLDQEGNPIKVVDNQPVPVIVFPYEEADVDVKVVENLENALTRWVDSQLAVDADWHKLGWNAASDEFRRQAWELVGPRVIQKIKSYEGRPLPAVAARKLHLVTGAELDQVDVLPWTRDGWERAMRLPVDEDTRVTDLWETSLVYWGRRFRRVRAPAAAAGRVWSSPATPAPAPTTTPPPTPPPATPPPNLGHFYLVGGDYFGDTRLIDALQKAGLYAEHIGMGDFRLSDDSDGSVEFVRYSDEALLPGQSGRLHRLLPKKLELPKLLARLEDEKLATSGGEWKTMEQARATPATTPPPATPATPPATTPGAAEVEVYPIEDHPVLKTAEDRLRAKGYGVTRVNDRLELNKDAVKVGDVLWAGRLRFDVARAPKGAEEFHAKLVAEVQEELQRCCDF